MGAAAAFKLSHGMRGGAGLVERGWFVRSNKFD